MWPGKSILRLTFIGFALLCTGNAIGQTGGSLVSWHGTRIVEYSALENLIAVDGGYRYCVGLRADGKIVAWGFNDDGQCNVPAPNSDFVAVSGGYSHCLGLKSDSSIVAWGENDFGKCDVPDPNEDFVGIAAGHYHSKY